MIRVTALMTDNRKYVEVLLHLHDIQPGSYSLFIFYLLHVKLKEYIKLYPSNLTSITYH